MSTDRDVTGIVRSWLEDGATSLPERVLDDVLAQVPTTPQRRAPWPAWRFYRMSSPFKIAVVAAAIGALAVVSLDVLPRGPDIGATPTPSPVAMPEEGDLEAGTTYAFPSEHGRLLVTVPATGWFALGPQMGKDVMESSDSVAGYDIRLLGPYFVSNINADPCRWRDSALEPPVGPTVDDLATALMAQPEQHASSVSDVTLGGYAGKKVELSVPDEIGAPGACDGGNYQRWYENGDPSSYGPFTWGSSQRDTVYIIDVEGTRWVIDTHYRLGVPESDLAELEQLVASIRFEPPTTTLSPSPSPALVWTPASIERDWPAPVREEPVGDPVVIQVADGYLDPHGDIESPDMAWIDILRVRADRGAQVDLGGALPSEFVVPGDPWIAYGLVFDTDLDGVADVRLGMDRVPAELTPREGAPGDTNDTNDTDVRAWRTDLRTGVTEFGNAGSSVADGGIPMVSEDLEDVLVEVLGASATPPPETVTYQPMAKFYPYNDGTPYGFGEIPGRFYAWASVIEDGRVVATDYAPDTGWLDPATINPRPTRQPGESPAP
jgi:hypothetical protein